MGMMVVARKVEEKPDEVRYEFGLDESFDRLLVIKPDTWETRVEDNNFDAPAAAISGKIKAAWKSRGGFPPTVLFAS